MQSPFKNSTALMVAIMMPVFSLMSVASARAFGRMVLWTVVNDLCVPGFLKSGNAFPCLAVDGDVKAGGVTIVPDLWASTHVLAVPTNRVPGIAWGGWGTHSADLGPWGALVSRCSSFHCKPTTLVCRAKTIQMGMFGILR